jgi:hypothetical protein
MITEVVHHINKRVPCDGCTTRVYAFATEHDADGNPTGRHFCRNCVRRGKP